ncbi:MAG: NADPH-dependent 7-cyano-7-deazaguanine reductase QueF [Coxiellaceae bacterium]|nr:MAG: NADPH-dependent 7-cyano-7-deazaguanine reductase QueF [Coxiellaceae bacterium]
MSTTTLHQSPLGKAVSYGTQYNPALLFPITRQLNRDKLHLTGSLPFAGFDLWTAYELTWLNSAGKPQIAVAEIRVPVDSDNLVESKSLKLYFNSFAMTKFDSADKVKATIQSDLSHAVNAPVSVKLILSDVFEKQKLHELPGFCLDHLPIAVDRYEPYADYLQTSHGIATETVFTHLFASNCPVTGQPDWAAVLIRYVGHKIVHEGLLKYLISYRSHTAFHEACAEQIFMDIVRKCSPEKLTVYMRFTRRGGIDINPYRSNFETNPEELRCFRQ